MSDIPTDQFKVLQHLTDAILDLDMHRVRGLSAQINWAWVNGVNTIAAETGYAAPPLEAVYRAFSGRDHPSSAAVEQHVETARPFITDCLLYWIGCGYNPIGDQHYFQMLRSSRTDDSFREETVRLIQEKGLTDQGISLLSRTADQLVASRIPMDSVIDSCLKYGADPNAKNDAGVPVLLAVLRKVNTSTNALLWDAHAPIRAALSLLAHGVDVYAPDTSTDAYLSASNPEPPLLRPNSRIVDTAWSWLLTAPLVVEKDPDAIVLLQNLSALRDHATIRNALSETAHQNAPRPSVKM